METLYTSEQNALTLIALMKSHNICKVVAQQTQVLLQVFRMIRFLNYIRLWTSVRRRISLADLRRKVGSQLR